MTYGMSAASRGGGTESYSTHVSTGDHHFKNGTPVYWLVPATQLCFIRVLLFITNFYFHVSQFISCHNYQHWTSIHCREPQY